MILPNNVSPIVKVYYGKPILPEVSRVLACLYEKNFKLVGFEDVDSMPIDLIRLQVLAFCVILINSFISIYFMYIMS